jgi:hypothetical protein
MANSNVVLGGLSEPHLFRGITGLSTPEDTPALLESPPSASDNAIAQLLRFESFESDWDGNFAAKPSHASLRDAKEFIRALAPESAIPEPALHADGTAVLLLVRSDHYAELEFLGSKRIGYFARRGDEQWNEDFSFDGVVLPGGLRKVGLALER